MSEDGVEMDETNIRKNLDRLVEIYRPNTESSTFDHVGSPFPFAGQVSLVRRDRGDPPAIEVQAHLAFFVGVELSVHGFLRGPAVTTLGTYAGLGSFGADPNEMVGKSVHTTLVLANFIVGSAVVHWDDSGTFSGAGLGLLNAGVLTGSMKFTRF